MALNQPAHGVSDWDTPLNANFAALDALCKYASMFSGADAGVKIAAAIAELISERPAGGIVDACGLYGTQTLTGFTIPPGVTVLLGNGIYTVNSKITVNDSARLIGCGSSFNKGTRLIAKANLNDDMIYAVSNLGTSDWWHWATISDLNVDGNKANQSTSGTGIHIVKPGEVSVLRNVDVRDCKDQNILLEGSGASGAGLENISVRRGGSYGIKFLNAVQTWYIKGLSMDDNVTAGVYLSAPNAGSYSFVGVKSEANTASTQNPVFLVDSAVDTGVELNIWGADATDTTGAADDFIKITGANAVRISGGAIKLVNYTNVINDVVQTRTITPTQIGSNIHRIDYGNADVGSFVNGHILHSNGSTLQWISAGGVTRSILAGTSSNDVTLGTMNSGDNTGWNFKDAVPNTVASLRSNGDWLPAQTVNGASWKQGQLSEQLTITTAASTDTSANLLPANSIIEAVVVRVTSAIPTAATFTVGDATQAARFASGVSTAGTTTAVGLLHADPTVATANLGPVQTSAAKVRITPNAAPGAGTGVVRITVYYRAFTAPTS